MDNPRALFQEKEVSSATRLLTLVGMVVVIAGLFFGRQVLIPLALAGVFAFLLTPIVELLEKCHLGRFPSVLIILVVSIALLAAVGWGVTNQLMQIMVHLPDYRANIHNKIEAVRAPSSSGLGKATETVNNLSKELSTAAEPTGANKSGKNEGKAPIAVQVSAPPRNASEYLREVIGPLTGMLETSGIMLIFILFILMKREDLRNRLLRLAGSGQLNIMTQAMDDASKRFKSVSLVAVFGELGIRITLRTWCLCHRNSSSSALGRFREFVAFYPILRYTHRSHVPNGHGHSRVPGLEPSWTNFRAVPVLRNYDSERD